MSKQTHGFTLVELLVVIAIIVVLLALLVPALDKAVYEATLATCAARIRGHIAGVQGYAIDHKRSYPRRDALFPGPYPQALRGRTMTNPIWLDDRTKLKPYVSAEFHKDPLAPSKISVYDDANEFSMVWSTYSLWYGWRFTNAGMGGRGSTRLGDAFEWAGQSYHVLVTDWDHRALPQSFASHPDQRDVLALQELLNDEKIVNNTPGVALATGNVLTSTFWYRRQAPAPAGRGLLDTNHGFQDNSVVTHRRVPFDVNPIYGYNGDGAQTAAGRRYDGGVTRIGGLAGTDQAGFDGGSFNQVSRN